MDASINAKINATNLNGISELKVMAKKDAKNALPQVARQFEAIFIQSMIKSMRKANEFISESNPFKSNQEDMFQDMMDTQMAIDLANKRGIGLAETLIKQMEKYVPQNSDDKQSAMNTANIEHNRQLLPNNRTSEPNSSQKSKPGIFDSVDDFVSSLWPHAKNAASQIGLDPKLLLAQAALETGWGKYVLTDEQGESSNNLFNIKANKDWVNSKVSAETLEFLGGIPRKVNANFKSYDSLVASFNDYISLIKNNDRYHQALASVDKPHEYINNLHQAGYATDPNYAKKIMSIYFGGELNNAIEALETN
jgi:flagellar protein FlgJ